MGLQGASGGCCRIVGGRQGYMADTVFSVTFDHLDDVETHVADLVSILDTAKAAVEATTTVTLGTTIDPDDATMADIRDGLLAGAVAVDTVRTPIQVAIVQLIVSLNIILEAYGATPLTPPSS